MLYEIAIHPCPECGQEMVLTKTNAATGIKSSSAFYFLHCEVCGNGPMQAYPSIAEAIDNWETYVAANND